MKWLTAILIALFIGAWFMNYPILSKQFDMESCMAQISFWTARALVYKFMFLFLCIVCFVSTNGLTKAFTCFALVLIIGDLVDKIIFGFNTYVYGDIILILLGLIASYYTYGRTRKRA